MACDASTILAPPCSHCVRNVRRTRTYDNANRVTRQDNANGTYVLYDYDVRDRVTEIDHQKSTNVRIVRERLTYDDAGNIVESIVASVTTTYSYDDINQLLTETYNGTTTSYTYDANGNRATKTGGGVTETYVYDDADKLDEITVGGTPVKEYGYDAAGRTTSVVTSAGTTTLSYDYESRITGITYPNTSTNSFAYNGFDTRVSKTDSAGTKTYRRDGAYVTDPVLTDGTTTFTPGISNRTGTTSKWEHPDHLGSNIRQTAAAETVTSTLRFDAFGNLAASSGTHAGPFGFAGGHGYQADSDSGLMLLGHRYYDSSTGRFLTRDPIKDGRNWYVYVDNNPVQQLDPSGLVGVTALTQYFFDTQPPVTPPGVDYGDNVKYIIDLLRDRIVDNPPVLPPFPGDWPVADPGLGYQSVVLDWASKVREHGAWDYKQLDDDPDVYDDAGNYNYGRTGAALGIPYETLQLAGDVDQGVKSGPPWEDEVDDRYWIRRGFIDFLVGRN